MPKVMLEIILSVFHMGDLNNGPLYQDTSFRRQCHEKARRVAVNACSIMARCEHTLRLGRLQTSSDMLVYWTMIAHLSLKLKSR